MPGIAPNRRGAPGAMGTLGQRGGSQDMTSNGNDMTFTSILCFGDYESLLQLNLESLRWEALRYDSSTSFTGNLRYSASAASPDGRVLLTGGCLVSTGDATNTCYEGHIQKPSKFTRKKMLNARRYAHASVFLNGYVYAVGGFDNKDADGVAPSTLDSVERYSIHENRWTNGCAMNEGRAFSGICAIGD